MIHFRRDIGKSPSTELTSVVVLPKVSANGFASVGAPIILLAMSTIAETSGLMATSSSCDSSCRRIVSSKIVKMTFKRVLVIVSRFGANKATDLAKRARIESLRDMSACARESVFNVLSNKLKNCISLITEEITPVHFVTNDSKASPRATSAGNSSCVTPPFKSESIAFKRMFAQRSNLSLLSSPSSPTFFAERRTRASAFSRFDSFEFVFREEEGVFFFSSFPPAETLVASLSLVATFFKPINDPSTFSRLSKSLFASLFSLATSDCSKRFLSAATFAAATASSRISSSAFSHFL